jgi:hypothetical protein
MCHACNTQQLLAIPTPLMDMVNSAPCTHTHPASTTRTRIQTQRTTHASKPCLTVVIPLLYGRHRIRGWFGHGAQLRSRPTSIRNRPRKRSLFGDVTAVGVTGLPANRGQHGGRHFQTPDDSRRRRAVDRPSRDRAVPVRIAIARPSRCRVKEWHVWHALSEAHAITCDQPCH